MNDSIKVLLIEDNPGDVRLIRELLKEAKGVSFSLECVDRLSTGLERLGQGAINIVLLDLGLPDSQGLDTFIRVHSSVPQVPIVILSGLTDEVLAAQAVREGAQDYLIKGQVDSNLLRRSLRYAIERKESEERFRIILDNASDGILVADLEAQRFYIGNKAICQVLGYSLEEIMNLGVTDIHPEKDLPYVLGQFEKQSRGEITLSGDIPVKRKDGSVFYADVNTSTITFGGKAYLAGIFRDTTERKRAEEALKREKEFTDSLITSMQDGISVLDSHGVHIDVNPAFCRMTGFSREELIGTGPPHPYWPPESLDEIERAFQKTLKGESENFELAFMRKDGGRFPVIISPSSVKDRQGNVVSYFATVKDITERRKTEEQLIVTDRLASVGELASGIAHEINNPLTSIIGFSELLLGRDVPDDIKEDLSIINREAHRTAGVVRNLLTFARKHTPAKQPVSLNSIIEKTMELRAYEHRVNNIQVDIRFAPDLPEVMADAFQLQQVFLNIIINAEHFMLQTHGRGTFTITTERVGDIIRSSLADDGPGIAPENLGHIFDPFFTTKEVGEGTGLGLSICHGITTEHGGRIYAKSQLGKGATFVVELPVAR